MHPRIIVAVSLFVVGMALHVLAQVDAIARAKNNPANSRLELLKDRWIPILNRSAVCLAFFFMWLEGELVVMLTAIKIPIPDVARAVLDLHVGGPLAFLAGISFDALLGFIPKLNTSLPPGIDAPAPPKA